MSYMRSIEGQLQKHKGYTGDIELDIPFWEFIDIEFDKSNKTFFFTAHYQQKPLFPELFQKLISSPAIKKIDEELNNKEKERIQQQDWKPREQYRTEIGAENIIYTLIDTKNKLVYIGETTKLIPRFDNGHPNISQWNYYKYNVLPSSLNSYRVTIERMMIRDMASVLSTPQSITGIVFSDYQLSNLKIDK